MSFLMPLFDEQVQQFKSYSDDLVEQRKRFLKQQKIYFYFSPDLKKMLMTQPMARCVVFERKDWLKHETALVDSFQISDEPLVEWM